ncbi:MAG: 2TM domain-containing protein [Leeuwenhoekiella sp.]
MFQKNKESQKIDTDQRRMVEYAQDRIKRKKNLFRHFIIFVAGAVLLIIVNEVLDYGQDFKPFQTPWFVWAILIWFFIFLVHFLNVFLINTFMGRKWREEQMDLLVAKQKKKIAEIQLKVDQDHPLPKGNTFPNRPDKPLNSE